MGKIKTEKEMWDWINSHDISPVITPEYFNHLTTLNDRELQEEVEFWDGVYTAQHYGRYKPRSATNETQDSSQSKEKRTRTHWITRVSYFLKKLIIGLVILWIVAYLIVLMDKTFHW